MFGWFKKKPKFDESTRICPKCYVAMEKEVRGGIIIDVCKKCGGMWLDKSEMEKLFEFMMNKAKVEEHKESIK